ncbi:MAG: hypothetical protein LC637_08825 [Xanthomonadaceae bacterium]|nr:hypothetical protein [Xanthomonadaceae bacterium]
MLNKTSYLIALMVASMFALSGCRAGAEIRNVEDAPIAGNPSLEKVRDAIIRAGANRGWRMSPQGDGTILGTLDVRNHVARINISYDRSSYNITYRESANLKHNPNRGTIHKNYNSWIKNLDTDIHNELVLIQ